VRDLILNRGSVDIDLVVLGEAEAFAEALARRTGGRVRYLSRFLTAQFRSSDGFHVDVVRARSERYETRAALPIVRSGTLLEDLARRDFTINALALPLNGQSEALLDPFGGLADIRRERLRVLHDRSFEDDPTRVLRGLRLGGRLGFRLGESTRGLAKQVIASGLFGSLSASRLRSDLLPLFEDPEILLGLLPSLTDLGLFQILHPQLRLPADLRQHLVCARNRSERALGREDYGLLVLCLIVAALSESELRHVGERLALPAAHRRILETAVFQAQTFMREFQELDSTHERFRRAQFLGPIGREIARCMGDEDVRSFLAQDWPSLCDRRLQITGDDLLQCGQEPGPAIGSALDATLDARLDGRISAPEELQFALSWMARSSK
jgi:tRNA nucleotidyltransferase (CCA-adding enzyme)